MAVTVNKRPEGYIITNQISTPNAFVTNNTGRAQYFVTLHGLATNTPLYVKSSVGEYNGFKLADVIDANNFLLKDDLFTYVPFVKNPTSNILYYAGVSGHEWGCVHLPLVYKLSNTLWPTNSADTVRGISNVTDSNGYCNITATADIKATGSAAALEFVKITNATDDDLNGVWQIITYSSDTSFVLNIPYSSANDTALTGALIQYYYNNYVTKVQVWGGLNSGHTYYGQKPFELLATLDLIPDEDNICMFSVSEILRKQIEIENNLLLGTLPNNLDAWTGFFIKYGEEYDDSDGTTLSRSTVTYTSDLSSFEGKAVNSILPFKNVYSGAMSEYVSADSDQKFLTNWERPTIFSGKYFDLGFISGFYNNFSNPALSEFVNQGSGTAWTTGATPSVTLADGASSAILSKSFNQGFKSGITYRIGMSVTNSGISNTFVVIAIDPVSNTVANFVQPVVSGGTTIFTVDITAAGDYVYFNIRMIDQAALGGGTLTINDYWVYPIDDPLFANVELRQGGEESTVEAFDQGVYRVPLTDPSCDEDSVDVVLYKSEILPLDPPSTWTDDAAWTSKNFTQFDLTDNIWPPGPSGSHTNLAATVGNKIRFPVTATLTGSVNGSVGFSLYLVDGGAIVRSNEQISLLTPATSPQTFEIELTATGTATVMHLAAGAVTGSTGTSGTVGLTLTFPETYTRTTDQISETKTLDINCDCVPTKAEEGIYLSWQNNVGHFDYWFFTAYKDHITDIVDSGEKGINTFPDWPESRGEFADTDRKRQNYRGSFYQLLVRSQHLTKEQVQAISRIKTSPLVQIVNSIYDRRTVIVDADSFTEYKEDQKLYEITFTITYTDDVPSQRV